MTGAQFEISIDGLPVRIATGKTSLYWPHRF